MTKKPKRRRKPELQSATVTPERASHLPVDSLEAIEQTGTTEKIQRVMAAPLDREHRRGRITSREFQAGDKCRQDAHTAKIDPAAPSVDWNMLGGNFGPRSPSAFQSQSIMDARHRHRDMKKGLSGLAVAIVDVVIVHENQLEDVGRGLFGYSNFRDARAAGFGALRVALGELATFYERRK